MTWLRVATSWPRAISCVIAMGIALVVSFEAAITQGTPALRFDVASVKPRANDTTTPFSFNIVGDGLTAINYPLVNLITQAYDVPVARLEKLPAWARIERFDVRARAARPASRKEMLEMLRALLSERFALKTHTESRVTDVYVLTREEAASRWRGLRQISIDCDNNQLSPDSDPGLFEPGQRPKCGTTLVEYRDNSIRLRHAGVTMGRFAESLGERLDRPVLDGTSLTGIFDIELHYGRERSAAFASQRGRAAAEPDLQPTLRDALKEQLRLIVVPGQGAIDSLVVDVLERPEPD